MTIRIANLLPVIACLLTAGCGSGGADLLKSQAGLVSAKLDPKASSGPAETSAPHQATQMAQFALPALPALPSLPTPDSDPVGSPTEIYTRVARGATLCWFGTHGTLKGTYIFSADAEPPSKGGRAEIVIHERDSSMPNPRGPRAFRVQILPVGDNARLEIENIRFPLETGQSMTADIRRWARNDLTCAGDPQTKGWDAQSKPPEAAPPPKKPRKPS